MLERDAVAQQSLHGRNAPSCRNSFAVTSVIAPRAAATAEQAAAGKLVRVNPTLVALAFGNFVIGTGTLIVAGMLPHLAEGLGVSLPLTGQLITAFAASVFIAAPLLAGATSRYDRRALLAAMQILFLFGHLAAALVSSFVPMLAVRVATSLGAAVFTAQAASTAALLVPAQERGRAIAFVFLGWSVASVFGLPVGSYIGATFGWRAGFAFVAALAALGAAAVWWLVPAGLKVQRVNAAMWRAVLTNSTLLSVLAATALVTAASFSLFGYFVPAASAFLDASPAHVSLLIAALGVMSIVGNTLSARFIDRIGPGNVVLLCLAAVLTGHLLWPWSAGHPLVLAGAVAVWGLGFASGLSAQQARLAALWPAAAPVSIALNSSATYLGQAIGAAGAGVLIAQVPGATGYAALARMSVPLLLAALALSLFASLRRSHNSHGLQVFSSHS
jgi:predicted MFS family arabinose efflux permease